MISSHRFLDFVFFGGIEYKIRVLDLSTGKLLPGHLETSIRVICSLQVFVKSPNEIYLAVSGLHPNYSDDKTDLFDVSGLFPNDPHIFQRLYSEYSVNKFETILPQPSTVKSMEEIIQKMTQERDSYKNKFTEIQFKYYGLKEKHDQLHIQNKKLTQKPKTPKKESKTKYHQINQMAINKIKKPPIKTFYLDDTYPLEKARKPKKNIQEEINMSEDYLNTNYDVLHPCRSTKDQPHNLKMTLDALQRKRLKMKGIITQR